MVAAHVSSRIGQQAKGRASCCCSSLKNRTNSRFRATDGEMVGSTGARSSGSARQPATGRAWPDPNKEAGRRQGKRRRLGEGLGAGASDEAGRDSSSTRARNRGNGGGLARDSARRRRTWRGGACCWRCGATAAINARRGRAGASSSARQEAEQRRRLGTTPRRRRGRGNGRRWPEERETANPRRIQAVEVADSKASRRRSFVLGQRGKERVERGETQGGNGR